MKRKSDGLEEVIKNSSEMKMNQESSWMSRLSRKYHERKKWWKRTGENKSSKEIKKIHEVTRRSYMHMHINIWTLIVPGDYLEKSKNKNKKMLKDKHLYYRDSLCA